FPQKVFVHTDKNFYVAGEIIWFTAYLVDGFQHKPIDLDRILYVELISQERKPVLQAKIALKEGNGNGSFFLPLSLNTGNYVLRAYTSWMKNFGPDDFFEQPLTIVNTLKKPKWQELQKESQAAIQFFPEGGNLVDGLKSKIGFKATDEKGRGVNCKGVIVDQKNDTITRFQSLRFGMGHFWLIPQKGNDYRAVVWLENHKVITQNLPSAYAQGYVLQLADTHKDSLLLEVQSNTLSDSLLYLLVHTRNIMKAVEVGPVQENKAKFIIDKKTLGEGISYFTLFNSARLPVCERLYFTYPTQMLDIHATTDKKEYGLRNKVTLDIQTNSRSAQTAHLSMAVFLVDSLQTLNQSDIHSYLWLTSELKGIIEAPDYYFNPTNRDVNEAMDNLMLTQGWRRFKWEEIFSNKKPYLEFLPEYEGQLITARILNKQTRQPVKEVTAYASIPQEHFLFNSASTSEQGYVHFLLKDYMGRNDVILQTDPQRDSAYQIDLVNPYSDKFSDREWPAFELSEKWKDQLVNRSIGAQVQNIYTKEQQQKFSSGIRDTSLFYGRPDKQYLLDEYTRFVTMEEVLREYVSEVRVRKQSNRFSFQVKNLPYATFFEQNPLIVLDGVPVFDINKLMQFDPLKIKKIEVVARNYFLGTSNYNGIVSYSTYKGDMGNFELNPAALVVQYDGLQLKREFYAPNYDQSAEARTPDYRNLLHWAPDITIQTKEKKELSFYTSDLPGQYVVVVQGITSDGSSGSGVYSFYVQDKKK
ncbi:MAG: hypothetical protein ICV65_14650, partial [Flavisolibacter sp.]|nr:hypothetical protein [Flavisolibacter sp.]